METNHLEPILCILNPDDYYDIMELPHDHRPMGCITPFQVEHLKEQGVLFPDNKPITDGLILVKHPTESRYIYRTEETDKEILQARVFWIQTIISYLGGKDLEVLKTESTTVLKENGVDVGVGAKCPVEGVPTTVNAKSENNKEEHSTEQHSEYLHSEWPGTYTASGYNYAKQIAMETGLIDDPAIHSILRQRDPSHPNPLKRNQYSVKISSDLQKTLSTLNAINGDFGSFGINVDVDVKTKLNVGQELTYDFAVSFGKLVTNESTEAISAPNTSKRSVSYLLVFVLVGVIAILGITLFLVLK